MTLTLSDQGMLPPMFALCPSVMRQAATITMAIEVEGGHARFMSSASTSPATRKTKDFVIRRELRFAEGDVVNAFILERGPQARAGAWASSRRSR